MERDVYTLLEYNKTLETKFTDAMLTKWTIKSQVAERVQMARQELIAKMNQYSGPGLTYPINMTREVNAWKKRQGSMAKQPENKASE